MLFLLAVFSLLIGVLIGSTSVGGVLLIPALLYLGGLSVHESMATALFSFIFTGFLGIYIFHRFGTINWRITVPLCLGSFLTSYFGAQFNASLSGPALNYLLATLIIISSLYSLKPAKPSNLLDQMQPRSQSILLFILGLGVGLLCALTGAGGGIISVPVMIALGFPPLASIATAQVLQPMIAVPGSISNASNSFIVYSMAWWVTALEMVGVIVGVRLAHNLPALLLKRVATVATLLIGIFIAASTLVKNN